MINGVFDCEASTTAGRRFATAVPDDVIITQGLFRALAWPRAQYPRERSSIPGINFALGCLAAASVRGDDLEPGQKIM